MDKQLDTFINAWSQTILSWHKLRKPILESEGITRADKRILYSLLDQSNAISKSKLTDLCVLELSSLTRSLDRLVKLELINRVADQKDKRYIGLSLTDAGKQKTKRIKEKSNKLFKKFFNTFTEDELEKMSQLMNKLTDNMREYL